MGNCTMCHGSIINTGQGSFNISSDVPTTGYVPGGIYHNTRISPFFHKVWI